MTAPSETHQDPNEEAHGATAQPGGTQVGEAQAGEGAVERIAHVIGAQGRLIVRLAEGEVVLHGVDGETVTVVDRSGRRDVVTRRGPGLLEVGTPNDLPPTAGGGSPGRLAGALTFRVGRQPRADLDIQVPRAASVDVILVSASVQAGGLAGEQHYKTVSGDVVVNDAAGGPIQAESISGNVIVRGRGRLAVRAKTISGDVEVAAGEFEALQAQTTSGDARLSGVLRTGEHRIDTISGSALLATGGGVTVVARTISGDVATNLPHRATGGFGRRTLVIGDGTARLTFHSMSGDLDVSGLPTPVPSPADEAQAPIETAPTEAAAPRPTAISVDPLGEQRLAILQALEGGEIDVDEAGRRLASLEAGS
ncbi:MAG TPA: DUF4097 family beta strand repeat-containing protein [Candidatus Limnocylindrales bacterium]|nr:DUF4097 family beta strand repeat-containing protein [Candidatus Limnocylindrales bacterium]